MEVRGQILGVNFLFQQFGFWGLDSDLPALWNAPLPLSHLTGSLALLFEVGSFTEPEAQQSD